MKISEIARNKESYMQKIQIKSRSFVKSTKVAIVSLESFIKLHHSEPNKEPSGDQLEYTISQIKDLDESKRIDAACDLCQMWINHLNSIGKSPKTVRDYFSFVKLYLHYRGIRLTTEDVRQSIDFPARINEERYPLVSETIHDILNTASYEKKGLYLALLSSGMRIGEAVQLQKKDVFTGFERVLIRVPAKITKTKQGRTTYISREAGKFIMPKLKRISDDDLVFGTNADPSLALAAEEKTFKGYLKKIGFVEKYDTGRLKISLHSFRAFFFTKAARVHDENYAHKMTGHGGYLMQYDRLTDEEKLEMYLELEPDLLIYDQTKNEDKIRRLKDANAKLADQAGKIREQERRIRVLERMYVRQSIPDWKGKI